jgi:hypothetical protein
MEQTLEFIEYKDIPEVFKNTLNKRWGEKYEEDYKNMGYIEKPPKWQISDHKEKMIFNSVFYRTIEKPHIYFWSLINKIR